MGKCRFVGAASADPAADVLSAAFPEMATSMGLGLSLDQIAALREYLKSAIGTMDSNISQYETAFQQQGNALWPYPGTYSEAKGRYRGYREIQWIVGG